MLTNRENVWQLAQTLGGVPVLGVLPASPSARAGIRYGDVVLAVGGFDTPDIDEYSTQLERAKAASSLVAIRVWRAGRVLEFELQLGCWDESASWDRSDATTTARFVG